MKNFVALALVAALLGVCGTAQAAKVWDDMSWWGNTGAEPLPQADSQGRSGYWWWPIEPPAGSDATRAMVGGGCGGVRAGADTDLWGNRGIVYHAWEKPEPPAAVTPPPPPPPAEPVPTRTKVMLNNVLFDFDKSELKPEGKQEVDKLIAEMKKYPGDAVVLHGHTCDIGDAAYNEGLGMRRANAVKNYMVEHGIAADRVKTVSHGENNPAVPNDGPANRKLNRRVEFEISMGS